MIGFNNCRAVCKWIPLLPQNIVLEPGIDKKILERGTWIIQRKRMHVTLYSVWLMDAPDMESYRVLLS